MVVVEGGAAEVAQVGVVVQDDELAGADVSALADPEQLVMERSRVRFERSEVALAERHDLVDGGEVGLAERQLQSDRCELMNAVSKGLAAVSADLAWAAVKIIGLHRGSPRPGTLRREDKSKQPATQRAVLFSNGVGQRPVVVLCPLGAVQALARRWYSASNADEPSGTLRRAVRTLRSISSSSERCLARTSVTTSLSSSSEP